MAEQSLKTLKGGIAGYDLMKAHTMAIAVGEHKPLEGEPKVWFTSIGSFPKVLSHRNRELLALIAEKNPGSLADLAALAAAASRICLGRGRPCRATASWDSSMHGERDWFWILD